MQDLVAILLTLATAFGLLLLLQWMGGQGILFAIPPANMYGIVVMRGDTSQVKQEGGGVVDVVHAVPGKMIVKPSHDQMRWHFRSGEETRDLLFRTLGVVWLGPFKTLRENVVRSFRYGREQGEEHYRVMSKDDDNARWVHYSSQQDIDMKDVETKDSLAVNFKMNIIQEDKYPVRARLVVADSNAVMTLIIIKEVLETTGTIELKKIISGKADTKETIANSAFVIAGKIRQRVGKIIKSVDIYDVSMNEKTRALMELEKTTEKQMHAEVQKSEQRVIIAANDAKASKKASDAEKYHNEKVILPLAQAGENAVRAREAEAYERNKTVTHSVRGGSFSTLV